MLDISREDNVVKLVGRFDASQEKTAYAVFDTLEGSCIVDFKGLEYISSIGLGVLLKTQKRLGDSGGSLKLINLNPHIWQVFDYARFDLIFDMQKAQ
jgi:anti-anti-sigma factor